MNTMIGQLLSLTRLETSAEDFPMLEFDIAELTGRLVHVITSYSIHYTKLYEVVMVLGDAANLREVILFPHLRPDSRE